VRWERRLPTVCKHVGARPPKMHHGPVPILGSHLKAGCTMPQSYSCRVSLRSDNLFVPGWTGRRVCVVREEETCAAVGEYICRLKTGRSPAQHAIYGCEWACPARAGGVGETLVGACEPKMRIHRFDLQRRFRTHGSAGRGRSCARKRGAQLSRFRRLV
jgi:hypothetical protein